MCIYEIASSTIIAASLFLTHSVTASPTEDFLYLRDWIAQLPWEKYEEAGDSEAASISAFRLFQMSRWQTEDSGGGTVKTFIPSKFHYHETHLFLWNKILRYTHIGFWGCHAAHTPHLGKCLLCVL